MTANSARQWTPGRAQQTKRAQALITPNTTRITTPFRFVYASASDDLPCFASIGTANNHHIPPTVPVAISIPSTANPQIMNTSQPDT
ncbi:hypothetical protein KC19_VG258600 [Ceratodon purpureus]|uniref:Uncharacterized protein n=1 Tax=Ceratodon purpureus TaxID=3225 RepID=A0A8T0HU51_CERPU|nr:hypothetical protein KC19_VG258600 [Ceratodon purpureus]